jgi:hypothetical protein
MREFTMWRAVSQFVIPELGFQHMIRGLARSFGRLERFADDKFAI